jgi:post-segregation antitoxin (ccd killing protein)
MPKVNVYLPDDLAEVARAAELSVSPICQAAIREELRKLQIREAAESDLQAVAARLRDTLDEEEAEQGREGHQDGVAWARRYATATELRWIARDFEPGRGGDIQEGTLLEFFSDKEGRHMVSLHPELGAYWLGFIEGAGEVLEAVEPLL